MKLEKNFTIDGKVVQPTGDRVAGFTIYQSFDHQYQETIIYYCKGEGAVFTQTIEWEGRNYEYNS